VWGLKIKAFTAEYAENAEKSLRWEKQKAERFPIFLILIIAFLSALCVLSGEIEFLAGGNS
jgi:hypothetical protein